MRLYSVEYGGREFKSRGAKPLFMKGGVIHDNGLAVRL